jgi:putative ABC transport system ATP-binding protein
VALIAAHNISKSFGQTRVFSSFNFDLEEGGHAMVMGPSGTGKSTLLNMIARLVEPDEGALSFRGVPFSEMSHPADFRLKHIGFMFQDFHLLENLTVFQNIDIVRRASPRSTAQLPINDMLSPLGLLERRDSPVRVLSRGERQRVALARAFANEPSVLLADEPTASLDPSNRGRTLDHLFSLCARFETTAIVVSHDTALKKRPEFKQIVDLEQCASRPG